MVSPIGLLGINILFALITLLEIRNPDEILQKKVKNSVKLPHEIISTKDFKKSQV